MKISRSPSAFSLVEVALSLGVAVFGMVTIFGLFPTGLNSNAMSIQQTTAANVLAGIVADLRQTPTAGAIASATSNTINAVSPRLGIDLTQSSIKGYIDESGAPTPGTVTSLLTSSPGANSRYQVNITIINPPSSPPATPTVRTATMATIQISWPAQAPLANAAGSLTSFIALDRN